MRNGRHSHTKYYFSIDSFVFVTSYLPASLSRRKGCISGSQALATLFPAK